MDKEPHLHFKKSLSYFITSRRQGNYIYVNEKSEIFSL